MKKCENCSRSEEEVPIIEVYHKQEEHYICSRCLPMLIHG
jgi:hypothetical protein